MEIPTYSMHKNYQKMGILPPFNPKFLGGRAYKRTVGKYLYKVDFFSAILVLIQKIK